MGKLRITDDKDKILTYSLKSHIITLNEESLILELETDTDTIKYNIHSDTREPDISLINQFILSELADTDSGIKPFIISEYLQRNYIYIGDIDLGVRRQFTASKING